ncbi:MAG: hypothetical protein JWM95_1735 [Gemmatimonadetes bacterium]|nr:hypothetical protein [Gemmatimonadota bacterium]
MTHGDEELPAIHPTVLASDQICDAMAMLDRHPDIFVRWPFPKLDALTGPMAPGNIWFVCATSGGGKTTFVSSIVDLWQLQGKRVYVMALETRPHEFRTYLACMATGVHPGDALSGQLRTLPDGGAQRELLKAELLSQGRSPFVERVMVSGARAINMRGLETGLKEAKAFKADVVIVDHIDHIEGDEKKTLYDAAKHVNDGALRMAQDNDLLLVFTSQLNMSASKGDYLAKFLPPKVDHVAFGSLKQRNATGMIGLFRPMRGKLYDESDEEYQQAVRAARAGTGDVSAMLEPNTMGVSAMKLRNYGSREGAKALLAVRHGRVLPLEERDQWATAGRYPRKMG